MNNSRYKNRIPSVKPEEALVELLSQWKLILIVMIIMAILTTGIRYRNDIHSYNAQLESIRTAQISEEKASKEDISINDILDNLNEQDRAAVNKVLIIEKFIDSQQEYLENSYLMKTDASNQHGAYYTLKVNADNSEDQQELIQGYIQFLKSNRFVDSVRSAIAPDVEDRYIRELIFVNWSPVDKETESKYSPDIRYYTTVLVIIPDGAALTELSTAVNDSVMSFYSEVAKSVPHSINIDTEEQYFNDNTTEEKRIKAARNIVDYETILATQVRNLSESQRAAYNEMKGIMFPHELEENVTEADVVKPGISKKSLLAGGFLGFAIYCFLFILLYIFNGKIKSPDDAEFCSDSRILGSIYIGEKRNKLFTSKIINNIRYKNQLSVDAQVQKAIRNIAAMCKHFNAERIAIPVLGKSVEEKTVSEIVNALFEDGIVAQCFEVNSKLRDFDEQYMTDFKYTVPILSGNETYVHTINEWMNICESYDVRVLGIVFYKEI